MADLSPARKHWAPPQDNKVDVANVPTCGPVVILCPTVIIVTPLDGQGDVANLPPCAPLQTFFPAVKHWGPNKRQR